MVFVSGVLRIGQDRVIAWRNWTFWKKINKAGFLQRNNQRNKEKAMN